MQKLNEMLKLVATAHAGQFDKAGKPYTLHCLQVMYFTAEVYGWDDEELLCIALGHDLIEDTNIDYQYLSFHFGARVANGIRALTKPFSAFHAFDYDEYKAKVKANLDAVRVKMQDLRHNSDITRLKGVTEKDLKRVTKYQQFYKELEECSKE